MAHIFEELSNAEQEVKEKKIAQASKHGLQAWQWMFLLDDDDEFEKCYTAATNCHNRVVKYRIIFNTDQHSSVYYIALIMRDKPQKCNTKEYKTIL